MKQSYFKQNYQSILIHFFQYLEEFQPQTFYFKQKSQTILSFSDWIESKIIIEHQSIKFLYQRTENIELQSFNDSLTCAKRDEPPIYHEQDISSPKKKKVIQNQNFKVYFSDFPSRFEQNTDFSAHHSTPKINSQKQQFVDQKKNQGLIISSHSQNTNVEAFVKPERKIVKIHEVKKVNIDSGVQTISGNIYKPIVNSLKNINEKDNLALKAQLQIHEYNYQLQDEDLLDLDIEGKIQQMSLVQKQPKNEIVVQDSFNQQQLKKEHQNSDAGSKSRKKKKKSESGNQKVRKIQYNKIPIQFREQLQIQSQINSHCELIQLQTFKSKQSLISLDLSHENQSIASSQYSKCSLNKIQRHNSLKQQSNSSQHSLKRQKSHNPTKNIELQHQNNRILQNKKRGKTVQGIQTKKILTQQQINRRQRFSFYARLRGVLRFEQKRFYIFPEMDPSLNSD